MFKKNISFSLFLSLALYLFLINHSYSKSLNQKSFRFAVISDMNKSYGSTSYGDDLYKAIHYIKESHHENHLPLVLTTGDMVAGQKRGLDYKKMWDAFHEAVTYPLKKDGILLAPSPGNHDASPYPRFKIEREHYKETWTNSKNHLSKLKILEPHNYPFYYAFTYESALFISLDATQPKKLPTEQFEWLQSLLDNHQDKNLKVVFGHIPLYPFAFGRAHEYMQRSHSPSNLENLFETYKVDLFLSGHHHVYYPGHRKGHTAYISVPLLGSGPRKLLSESSHTAQKGFLIIEYHNNRLDIKAIDTSNMSLISHHSLPERIQVPKQNSSSCRSCSSFPKTHFLDSSIRSLYHRIDL